MTASPVVRGRREPALIVAGRRLLGALLAALACAGLLLAVVGIIRPSTLNAWLDALAGAVSTASP